MSYKFKSVVLFSKISEQDLQKSLLKPNPVPSFLRIWSHLLKKSLMENFFLCAILLQNFSWKIITKSNK